MSDADRAKFDAAVDECRRHADILGPARQGLPAAISPADVGTSATRRLLGQAAYRFMKLQDSLDEKVLPGILRLLLEPLPPEAPFAEKLQRLERLGVVGSVASWRMLREVRNSLAHAYPENPARQAAALTRLVQGVDEPLVLWTAVGRYGTDHIH